MMNPFYSGIDIPDEYFCDREAETKQIISYLDNGSNIVLKAPRRIGKSSLIKHVFGQEAVRKKYNTLFVDVLGTKTPDDFVLELQRAIFAAPFAKGTRLKKEFDSMLKGAYLELGEIDATTGKYKLPRVGFSPSTMPKMFLGEIMDFLNHTSKPNIVVFDEFQQIEQYTERMTATLRSYIQQMNNTRFIFSGSSQHMLTTMFQVSNQPFYKSAKPMDLDILDMDKYVEYCQRMFGLDGRTIDEEAVRFAYYLFSGETYLMQETMKEVFAVSNPGDSLHKEQVVDAILSLLDGKESDYRDILNRLDNKKERNTLFCIAAEGIASGLTGSNMMKRYNLDNASSVQNALNNLGDEGHQLIERIGKGVYVIKDRLFELWIAHKGGYLEYKFENAPQRFIDQRKILSHIPSIPSPLE